LHQEDDYDNDDEDQRPTKEGGAGKENGTSREKEHEGSEDCEENHDEDDSD
jgi:hypothetical protein